MQRPRFNTDILPTRPLLNPIAPVMGCQETYPQIVIYPRLLLKFEQAGLELEGALSMRKGAVSTRGSDPRTGSPPPPPPITDPPPPRDEPPPPGPI
ncbi:unnamed protein product [Nezara viridula]|uniref:Uncharacterized protein n=1 Tax=Nezara viridula TaxID=85310 RepID=A0A9P0HHQ5_NEZVI|nr:unnamed protein product [Nezara viridula]